MVQPCGTGGEPAGTSNFATIKTTSIVSKQHKEHMQEDMHAAMSGYKRMRQEHQRAQAKVLLVVDMNLYINEAAALYRI